LNGRRGSGQEQMNLPGLPWSEGQTPSGRCYPSDVFRVYPV